MLEIRWMHLVSLQILDLRRVNHPPPALLFFQGFRRVKTPHHHFPTWGVNNPPGMNWDPNCPKSTPNSDPIIHGNLRPTPPNSMIPLNMTHFHPFLCYKNEISPPPIDSLGNWCGPRTIWAYHSPPAMPTSWLQRKNGSNGFRDGDLEGAPCYLGKGWIPNGSSLHSHLAVDLRLTWKPSFFEMSENHYSLWFLSWWPIEA